MQNDAVAVGTPKVFRVSELTRRIKNLLEDAWGDLAVEGELSNLRRPASGHVYFVLKDEHSQLAVVLFRSWARGCAEALREGALVRASGQLSVYERSGSYQLIARRVEVGGRGALQEAFEALKRRLAAAGLFAAERKRLLPLLPRCIGVVTSPTGAAIRDILNILGRRAPQINVLLAPVRVQGAGAAAEVSAAIDLLNQIEEVEVIIVGRGGGSLEDLWCFNEEPVARAIAGSRCPVISAVGHETDVTISDFVADVRAPTPSAAAELVVRARADFINDFEQTARRLARALRIRVLDIRNRFTAAAASHVFRQPGQLARARRERLPLLARACVRSLRHAVRERQQQCDESQLRLLHALRTRAERARSEISRLDGRLRAVNPAAVLGRGYSLTLLPDGRCARSVREAAVGDRLRTRLLDGILTSEVIAHE